MKMMTALCHTPAVRHLTARVSPRLVRRGAACLRSPLPPRGFAHALTSRPGSPVPGLTQEAWEQVFRQEACSEARCGAHDDTVGLAECELRVPCYNCPGRWRLAFWASSRVSGLRRLVRMPVFWYWSCSESQTVLHSHSGVSGLLLVSTTRLMTSEKVNM